MKKKSLCWVMLVMALGIVFVACATAPKAFETAGSLAGTQWGRLSNGGDLVEFHDAASGVYTDTDGKEIPFTYTAPYNAEKRIFTGKLTRADGVEWEFTVKGGLGWSLWHENSNRQYLSPEQLQMWRNEKGQEVAFLEQYGEPYCILDPSEGGVYVARRLKRDSDGKEIIQPVEVTGGFDFSSGDTTIVKYILHSKDGVTVTMEGRNMLRSGNGNGVVVGTFKLSINEKTVTISNGTGEGAPFNGVWKTID